jgi:hypothetical protein
MNEDFSQRLFERIEHEQVKPLPRWVIVARRVLSAFLILLSILCGGLLASLLFLAFLHIDLEFLRASSLGPMLRLVLDYVPVVWIVLFLGFCGLEVFLLRHETRAYRYSWLASAGFVVVGISLLGLALYATRLPERVEQSFQRHLPPHLQSWAVRRPSPPRPEDGVLFGRVLEVGRGRFRVEGPRQDRWDVGLPEKDLSKYPFLRIGERVLIEGKFIRPGQFEAAKVRPYRGRLGLPPPSER